MVFAARDGMGQLIILGLLFIGWVIKEVTENAKRKRGRQPPARSRERMPLQAEPEPTRAPDLVYGDRAMPHLPRSAAPAPLVQPPRASSPARRPTSQPQGTALGTLRLADEAPLAARPGERGAQFEQTNEAASTTRSLATRRRTQTLRRLHITGGRRSMREKVRLAVLWSEVLGPCRSVRGPHRSPAAERRRRG